MKKVVQLFIVLCMVILGTQAAFANANKVTIAEGADLTAVHRLAIAAPLYVPRKDEPSKAELIQVLADTASISRSYVVPYATMVADIKKDANIDMDVLDRHKAAKVYKEHVADYADAYVVTTVANDSHTSFFFDVYKAGTNQLLYTFQIVRNSSEDDSIPTYKLFAEQFYKNFDRSAVEQQEQQEKAAKTAHKK
jgi:hypothetical protein